MFYIIMFCLVSLVFRIIFNIKVTGKEIIQEYKSNGRPYVICANHVSMLDPIFIVIVRGWGKKLSILGKAELFKGPILSWMFTQVGVIPVDRGKGDKGVIEKAMSDIRNGSGMLIFPEGTRSGSNQMGKLKSGAFMIAAGTSADIIPCRIIYDTKDGGMKFFGKVVVNFGEPLTIEQTQLDSGSRQQIRDTKAMLENSLNNLLEEYNAHH